MLYDTGAADVWIPKNWRLERLQAFAEIAVRRVVHVYQNVDEEQIRGLSEANLDPEVVASQRFLWWIAVVVWAPIDTIINDARAIAKQLTIRISS